MSETVAAVTLGVVLVGGVYLLLPSWSDLPSGDQAENTFARILVSPLNIAGKVGSSIGSNIMYAAGFEFTAADLERIRPELYARSTIPGTPENAAKRLHDIMQLPGQKEQLTQLQTELLGSDAEWNAQVAAVFYPMFSVKLNIAMDTYMSQ